jgi:UDP-N-acetyl-D-mannosaminuronic acid dehydrogenase
VGTPVTQNTEGKRIFSPDGVYEACKLVRVNSLDGDLIVLRSTVSVGTTKLLSENASGNKEKRLFFAYAPERTLEGQALMELRSLPQVVSAVDDLGLELVAEFFESAGTEVVRVNSTAAAELAKLVNNVERDTQFAFSNEIAGFCDEIGVRFSEVHRASTLGYSRSSLRAPGPVAGPCLSKDGHILAASLSSVGTSFASHARNVNSRLSSTFLSLATRELQALDERLTVVLSGIAFKGRPPTSDFRDSHASEVLTQLQQLTKASVILHDYEALPNALFQGRPVRRELMLESDAIACLVTQNNHPKYELLDLESVASQRATELLVIDFWNQFTDYRGIENLRILSLGEGGAWL